MDEKEKIRKEPAVPALRTYKSDIESTVRQKNVSVVSIAAAEAERRAAVSSSESPATTEAPGGGFSFARIAMVVLGVTLILGAVGLLVVSFVRPESSSPLDESSFPPPPFIAVDDTTAGIIPKLGLSRQQLMQNLTEVREDVDLSLGLIARIYLAQETETPAGFETLGVQELMVSLAPEMPQELLRSLREAYLLGVHSFDGNQPLLIFSVDSFEHGYAGMLAWESTMQGELAPFFTREPRPRIPEEGVATTTPLSPFLKTRFVDRIVENRDTRVIQNEYGDILLLWTLLDRTTILITTNEFTLREVVSRQQRPPVIPLP